VFRGMCVADSGTAAGGEGQESCHEGQKTSRSGTLVTPTTTRVTLRTLAPRHTSPIGSVATAC